VDLASAARREVAEEVGLGELDSFAEGDVLFDVDIHTIPARKAEPAHEHFDARFAFVARTRDFARTEEVADVRWVPLERLTEVTCDESVLRAARKLFAADRLLAERNVVEVHSGGRTSSSKSAR
jgi:8-oxo-dGTP pyrophosphatase MutT (NUDIX family)